MALAKEKDSDVQGALQNYKDALKAKFKREGYTGPESKAMLEDEMADLQSRIAELLLTPSEEEDTGIVRPHTIDDALELIRQDIEDMAEEEESYDDEDTELGYDDVDYDDDWKPGMMDAAHHIPIGQLKLEALKKKLVK